VSRRDINIAASLFGGSMVLLAFTPNLGFAFPIGIIVGLASVTFMTTSTSIMQIRADPAMRGRVLALQAIVFLGSTPIGGPIVGWVCEHFSPRVGLLVGAVSCFVAVAYGVWGAGPTPRPEPVRASGADAIVDMPAMIDVPSPAGGE
jgi:MFS family permease